MKPAAQLCRIYSIEQINKLELLFMKAIDYKLMVKQSEFDQYFNLIMKKSNEIQQKEFKVVLPKFEIIEDHFYPEHTKDVQRIQTNRFKNF